MKAWTRFFTISSFFFSTLAFGSVIQPPGSQAPAPHGLPRLRVNAKAKVTAPDDEQPALRFGVQPNTAPWGNWLITNDAAEDIEPSVVRAYRSDTWGNPIETALIAYMKRFANGKYQLNTVFRDGDGYYPAAGPLPLPAPYTTSADPIIGTNPYPDGTQPKAFYVIGTAQAYTQTGGALQNSIMVWCVRDGEITWQRTTLATNTDPQYFADKPWLTVSWYPQNRGWVYATYAKVGITNGAGTIYIYRSIDGINYQQLSATISGQFIHSPTVLVDSVTGTVYLLYISYLDNKIYITYLINDFTFAPPVGFDAGSSTEQLLGPIGMGDLIYDSSNVAVLARSLLHARYNWVDRSIGVVWHRREPNSQRSDVYFNSYSTLSGSWRGVKKVNQAGSGTDQWNGALDFDYAGHYVVAWYDRRDDPTSNRQYAIYATMLNANGDRLDWSDSLISAVRPGMEYDPTLYEPYTGRNAILLGEYHDVWSWYDNVNSRMVWNCGDVGVQWTKGDIWLDQIQP